MKRGDANSVHRRDLLGKTSLPRAWDSRSWGRSRELHEARDRCLFPEPPPPGEVPSCAEGGVLGVLPGTVGLLQATEVVKLLLDKGDSLVGRMVLYDALDMKFREVKLRRNAECPVCGDAPTIKELIDYNQFCGLPGHSEAAG